MTVTALQVLFTSDAGLMSLGVIIFIIAMGWYLKRHISGLMNDKPGKEGW